MISDNDITSNLSVGYTGHCEVKFKTHKNTFSAVFPNTSEAFKAANFSINPQVGGYLSAIVLESKKEITYKTGEGWLFDEEETI